MGAGNGVPDGAFRLFCRDVAVAGAACQLLLVAVVALNLPWTFPAGGPDEPRHRSVTLYLARHLHWPSWDSPELIRDYNCVTYATLSSAGYWVEGLLVRAFRTDRLSGVLLLAAILVPALWALRKAPQASLACIALLTPQALFIFGYVNSDNWVAVVAFYLGVAIELFLQAPNRSLRILFLFVMAGACVSCRPHLWPIGALAVALAALPRLPSLLRQRRRALTLSLAAGGIVSLWWPTTSYLANDGDPLGFQSTRRSVERFCPPMLRPHGTSWSEFPVAGFARDTSESFYGLWGWLAVELPAGVYLVAAALGGVAYGWLVYRMRQRRLLIGTVFAANVALLVVYGLAWDYQPQGRYLFPALFISLGVMLGHLSDQPELWPSGRNRWLLGSTLAAFLALNIAAAGILLAASVMMGDSQ